MKCLLEAHDSNPARFDRECLIHLSSRLRMWELAAKVGMSLFTICGFELFEDIFKGYGQEISSIRWQELENIFRLFSDYKKLLSIEEI